MDFREFVRFVRTYVWLLVATVLLGAALGSALCLARPKTYEATSQVLFSTSGLNSGQDFDLAGQYLILRMPTYSALSKSRAVLEPVTSALHLSTSYSQLAGNLSTSVTPGTTVLAISARQPTARRAQQASLGVARSLINLVAGRDAGITSTASSIRATIVTAPSLPHRPSSPSLRLYIVGGALLGLVAGLLLGLVLWLRKRWSVVPVASFGTAVANDTDRDDDGVGPNPGEPEFWSTPRTRGPVDVPAQAVSGEPVRTRSGRGRRRRR